MRKIITIQTEVDLSDKWYGGFTNSQLLDMYVGSDLDFSSFVGKPLVFIAVNDATESEKADADSTGEVDGTTELHEVPC